MRISIFLPSSRARRNARIAKKAPAGPPPTTTTVAPSRSAMVVSVTYSGLAASAAQESAILMDRFEGRSHLNPRIIQFSLCCLAKKVRPHHELFVAQRGTLRKKPGFRFGKHTIGLAWRGAA